MTKTMTVYLASAITFNGAIVDKGESIELPEKSAKALIEEGLAEAGTSSKAKKGTSQTSGEKDGQSNEEGEQGSETDENELIRKALDDKYKGKVPELKEHAKEADVQVPYDATKADIIEAIIKAGKAEAIQAK